MKYFLLISFIFISVIALAQDSSTVNYGGRSFTVVRYDDSITVMYGTRENRENGFMWIWQPKFYYKKNRPIARAIRTALKQEEEIRRLKTPKVEP